MHHILVDSIAGLVTHRIRNIINFASLFEDEFVKLVVDENYRQVPLRQKSNRRDLAEATARDKELDRLYEKIYEDQALGKIPEEPVFIRWNDILAGDFSRIKEKSLALRQ